MKVGIVGLGYVGLPLALASAEAGCDVVGVDTDARRVERLRRSESDVEEIDLDGELGSADVACIVTAHPEVDHERVVRDAKLVLDFRGITRGITAPNLVRL